ncbi:hypothetical protein, partial [Acidovorax sp. SUPP2522]|uniref:hypothetical protein n=1 Tax=Acidovorax sp. SUPP2522 TaxID=511900 RepID=UPI0024E074FF
AFSAALYAFQFVVRYLLRCLFFVSVTQSVYGHQHRDLCNKALPIRQARGIRYFCHCFALDHCVSFAFFKMILRIAMESPNEVIAH